LSCFAVCWACRHTNGVCFSLLNPTQCLSTDQELPAEMSNTDYTWITQQ
jgi:hypothetical protein